MCDFCFLMVDMVWDIRKCGTLDVGNGRLGLDVDNEIDFRVSFGFGVSQCVTVFSFINKVVELFFFVFIARWLSLSHVYFGLDFSRGSLGIPNATNEISARHFWEFPLSYICVCGTILTMTYVIGVKL